MVGLFGQGCDYGGNALVIPWCYQVGIFPDLIQSEKVDNLLEFAFLGTQQMRSIPKLGNQKIKSV